ncbi:MAG TPA: lytic transglycosylase domain-containing protein, partial [Aestuariivirgaceae bacterium]|nr:lytic transglycosylase domain-containing protein [Aestuariivirgaceae bacterium]
MIVRSISVAFAVAVASVWNTADGAEVPAGSNPIAATSTGVAIALLNPSGAAISNRADVERPALNFTLQGPAPVPLAKPRLPRFQPLPETICGIIETAAEKHELPVGFLTRLIWQESRFRVTAVSHAGAQGIAQFMPATAAERDLDNPFDPEQALWAAASLLS